MSDAPPKSPPLPLLGLDVGDRRIGVALADETGQWVHAVETLERGRGRDEMGRLRKLLALHGARGFVVGLPLLASGGEGEQAGKTRRFVAALATQFPRAWIAFADERLSTFAADDQMAPLGLKGGGPGRDAHAARHILETFLREGALEVVQSPPAQS